MEAVVMFDYEKQQEDELTLKVGETLYDVIEVDEGWCEGTLNGKRGMFPDNFVELKQPSNPPAANPVPLRNNESNKKIRRAEVAFSYAADNSDELSLQPGQIVEVLAEEEEGWWRGRVNNREGVFPSNFVKPIEEEPSSKPVEPPPPAVVDSQTGERPPPSGPDADTIQQQQARHPVHGPMVMPGGFDPSKARANLKKPAAAPPLEKPPEHKTVAPPTQTPSAKPSEEAVERAKVMFDYEADNPDELTIKVGEIVEIQNKDLKDQEGWWLVSMGGRTGLIPDNFVEVLPAQPVSKPAPSQPKQPPKPSPPQISKEPAPKPAAKTAPKKPEPKKPPPPSSDSTDGPDFPVPKTTPLDTSAMRDRPKTKNRPPSRSNLLNHDAETPTEENAPSETPSSTDTKVLSPWQAELAKRKQPKIAPKPVGKPKPPVAAPGSDLNPTPRRRVNTRDVEVSKPEPPSISRFNTGGKSELPTKPPAKPSAAKPPLPKVEAKQAQDTPSQSDSGIQSSSVSATSSVLTATPTTTPAAPAAPADSNGWKEAYEKLREEFEKFKEHVTREIQILTDDLDKERKHRAGLDIDIDRLKKAQRSLYSALSSLKNIL